MEKNKLRGDCEMTDILKLVLTDHWFDEIKSGRKTQKRCFLM